MAGVAVLISGHEKRGDHTVYLLQVACGGKEWTAARRYSQFDSMHKQLHADMGAGRVPAELPGKRLFGRFSESFIADRRGKLQAYLGACGGAWSGGAGGVGVAVGWEAVAVGCAAVLVVGVAVGMGRRRARGVW
jgi:hypothetical protein